MSGSAHDGGVSGSARDGGVSGSAHDGGVSGSAHDGGVSGSTRDVVIIGAGFSGLGAAIRLKAAGIEDFAVLERQSEVGGTWNGNRYPGCQCDVPSNLYCYSFAPHPGGRERSPSARRSGAICATASSATGCARTCAWVSRWRELAWEEDARRWRLETSDGPLRARIVIAAMGALSEPALPALAGIEDFGGRLFHSADWPAGPGPAPARASPCSARAPRRSS